MLTLTGTTKVMESLSAVVAVGYYGEVGSLQCFYIIDRIP
jgi:hypothetical protein